jgi:hypothetical protein
VPRPRPLPSDDALLSAEEACALVHVSRSRWDAYAARFHALVRGRRIVQVNPKGKGVTRWLKSAVIEHMHHELAREREAAPASLPHAAGRTSGDVAGFMSRKAGSDSPARYQSAPVRDVRGTPLAPVTPAACPDRGASTTAVRRVS